MSRTALSSHHSRLTVFAESLAFDDDDYELTSHAHAHREHTRELPSFTHSACSRSAVRESTCACVAVECRKLSRQHLTHLLSLGASAAAPRHLALFLPLGAQGTSVCLRFYCFCCCKTMIPPLSRVFSLSVCAAGPKPKVTFVCRRL